MYRVLNCLVTEHDWRLVVLAGAICSFASAVAISLFHRARASHGRTRAIWICLDATVGGCGIWATHFVAMLAYDPGAGAGYSIPVTLLSLLFAVCIVAIGLCVALSSARRVGRCDRRCDHRRRCRGDALYRHGGTRASGLHCLGPRYRFGLDRFRKRIRGACNARRRASRRFCSYPGRRRPADSRNRFTSFHGHGRRHARSRSDARLRRVNGFSGRAFVSDLDWRLCHSRHIAAGGHVRSPRKGRTP